MTLRCSILAFVLLAAGELRADPSTLFKPGVVSYTYRDKFAKDLPGTLDLIKGLGMTDIEFSNLFGKTATEIRKELDARGMTCSSFGTGFDDCMKKPDEVAANAKALGAKFVRIAWLPNRQPFTPELAEQTIKDFNAIGKTLGEQGLTFCYHEHGYEFVKAGDHTLFDELVEKTDPRYVSFELDILWAFFGGADPAALLEKHGKRFKLMHLKDLKKGVTGDLSGKTAVENDVALGTGQLNLPAIINAAAKAGIEHAYIEDESPNTATQVPQSLTFLRELKD